MTRTPSAAASSARSAVPSIEPSETTISSNGSSRPAAIDCWIVATFSTIAASWLKTGTTTLSRTSCRAAAVSSEAADEDVRSLTASAHPARHSVGTPPARTRQPRPGRTARRRAFGAAAPIAGADLCARQEAFSASRARRRPAAGRAARSRRPRPRRRARRPPSRPPAGHRPSPRARRSRSPRGATARRRRPRARSTARAAACGTNPTASGTRSGPAPTITRGRPSVAARNSRMPFSGERRPTKSTCGGSSGSPTPPGSRRRSGSRAPRARRARRAASARTPTRAITSRARRRIGRKSHGARRASSTSVPQSWTTNGLPVASAAKPGGSQCAWTRSASRAARRAARAKRTRKTGRSSASHGRRRRLPTIPCP